MITATGKDGAIFTSANIYQLNNSEEYESQRQNSTFAPTEAYDISINPMEDMTAAEGYWYQYAYDPNDAAIVQGGGSKVSYDINVLFPGIYRVEAQIGGTVGGTEGGSTYPTITIDTDADDGYRAEILASHSAAPSWMGTDADGAAQYVYLKEGINHVEVTAGNTHHELWALKFCLLTAEEEATITMDDCKLTPPRTITINPYTDTLTEGGEKFDYHFVSGSTPPIGEGHGTQLVSGDWQRFEVTAKVAGTYQVTVLAAVYSEATTFSVETMNSKATIAHEMSPDNYLYATGTYVTLEEGTNVVWVRNDGPGWAFVKAVNFDYVEDTTEVAPSAFIQGFDYIGRPEALNQIPEYTVRNNYHGIHVADTTNTTADTITYQYNVTIPADDYYGLMMTGTVPLTPNVVVTLSDGVNDDIVLVDGELPYFGNENQSSTVTLTEEKVFLTAGEYTMTFELTENEDAADIVSMMTHVHSFEFTTLTRQDMFLAAMQSVQTTEDVKAALEEYRDVLTSDITATPDTDFIYPEYAYNALLNCAMLETGAYETYEDVKTAYDFAKNMITAADDGSGALVYTVQVGDWNELGTTVLVAVYTSTEDGGQQLYMMGEGYLDYEEAVGTYVPVEAPLYDYIPEPGDTIKVFIWDSFDGLKPVF